MLILTRRLGEKFVIGENAEIEISVLKSKGSQVIIGIDAPREIPVHREEIYQRIQAERSIQTHGGTQPCKISTA